MTWKKGVLSFPDEKSFDWEAKEIGHPTHAEIVE